MEDAWGKGITTHVITSAELLPLDTSQHVRIFPREGNSGHNFLFRKSDPKTTQNVINYVKLLMELLNNPSKKIQVQKQIK